MRVLAGRLSIATVVGALGLLFAACQTESLTLRPDQERPTL